VVRALEWRSRLLVSITQGIDSMDGSHFDTLSRSFSTAGSRRRALGGLLLGALGLLHGGSAEDALAHDLKAKCKKKSGEAKKKCLKKAKKHAAAHTTPPPPGGCPSGQKACGGGCIPSNQCCTNGDCPSLRPQCQQGACTCPPERPVVCSDSPACRGCCTKADCTTNTVSGLPDCHSVDKVCFCPNPAYHYCPAEKQCGTCCVDSDCTGGRFCEDDGSDVPMFCVCSNNQTTCDDICVPEACGPVCNSSAVCSGLAEGASCCGNGAMTCQAQGGPTGPKHCLPPL
jgi:hypothetical protein